MLTLLLGSIALLAVSGLPAIVTRRRFGEIVSCTLAVAGAAGGITAAVATLGQSSATTEAVAWQLPNARLVVRLDPLSAAFLLPILVLGLLASIYALAYWRSGEQPAAGSTRVFTGLLVAGMSGVVIASHAMLFLLAWETMAIAAFFLIAADDREEEVREAAWMYLIATHVGTLALFAMFTLLRVARGTFLLGAVDAGTGMVMSSAILLLALAGFGFKAGIVPLHFWLPGAHANAPSHVSALLSGAMLKVGVYGIVRIILFLPHPPLWWGGLLIIAGLTSALIAITLSTTQSDLKRALAYSSVENIGIIVAAVGLFVMGRAAKLPLIAALGLTAAIAHVWSHSIFKGLLFFSAGSVLHATGTRRIERLGGLLKKMPLTGSLFVIGAAAASALPGTTAFVSEAILYVGLLRQAIRGSVAALGAAVVALVGALAVVSFVRLTGTVFLGSPRSSDAEEAHEAPLLMRLPMVVLAIGCIVLGVFPQLIAIALANVTGEPEAIAALLSEFAFPLQLAAVASGLTVIALIAMTRRSRRGPTWDCGYAQPTERMQYTARSLGQWLTARLTPRFLAPEMRVSTPRSLYPLDAQFSTRVDEPFLTSLIEPLASRWGRRAMRLRWLQQGRLPIYLLYIFVTLLAAMVWVLAFPFLGGLR